MIAYLEQQGCNFLKPDLWQPNSPDLNLCDYAIWGVLEDNIWKRSRYQIKTLDDLKRKIIREWDKLPQEMIDRSIDSFRKWLRMVIERNGGHIVKYR